MMLDIEYAFSHRLYRLSRCTVTVSIVSFFSVVDFAVVVVVVVVAAVVVEL